jgi:hypothetical protein
VKFSCGKCGRSYVADERVRGRAFKMKCKQCGSIIVVKPAAAPDALASAPVPLPAPAPQAPVLRPPPPPPLPFDDPFALEAPPAPDPFAPPPDPFAAPAPDPFAAAAHDPALDPTAALEPLLGAAPGDEIELEPAVAAGGARSHGTAAADSGVLPASPPFPAERAGATGGRGSRINDVEALFADLAEEMKEASPSPARPAVEPRPSPVAAAARPPAARDAAVTPPAGTPRHDAAGAGARSSAAPARAPLARRAVLLSAAAAAAVAMVGAAWVLAPSYRSPRVDVVAPDRASTRAPAAAEPPAPASRDRARAAAAASRPAPDDPAPAASRPDAPPRRAEAATPKEREPRRAELKPVAKPGAPAPKPAAASPPARKLAAAASPPAPPAQAQPAPEPPKGEVSVAQVEVRRRSSAPQAAPPEPLHTSPSAPPLTSNSDLPPLDDGMIAATVAKYESAFDACVAAARQSDPALAISGRRIVVTMTVNPNGHALYPTLDDVQLGSTDLGRCLKRESGKMVFPAFGGEPIRARVPLTLR